MPRRDAEREAQDSLIRTNNLAIARMAPPAPPPDPGDDLARLEDAVTALRIALPICLFEASRGRWTLAQQLRLRELRGEIDRIAHPGPYVLNTMATAAREALKDG